MSNPDYETSAQSAPEAVAEFDHPNNGFIGRLQNLLHTNPAFVPLIVLMASIVIFGVLIGSRFFSPFAMTLILQQVQIVGIVAAAQSLVILTAGIDLSVGAIMVLSSVVMGQSMYSLSLSAASMALLDLIHCAKNLVLTVSVSVMGIVSTGIPYETSWYRVSMLLPV